MISYIINFQLKFKRMYYLTYLTPYPYYLRLLSRMIDNLISLTEFNEKFKYDLFTENMVHVFKDFIRQQQALTARGDYYDGRTSIECALNLLNLSYLTYTHKRVITHKTDNHGATNYTILYSIYLLSYLLLNNGYIQTTKYTGEFSQFQSSNINEIDCVYLTSEDHAVCCYKCDDDLYYYDDNHGLKIFDWATFFKKHNKYYLVYKPDMKGIERYDLINNDDILQVNPEYIRPIVSIITLKYVKNNSSSLYEYYKTSPIIHIKSLITYSWELFLDVTFNDIITHISRLFGMSYIHTITDITEKVEIIELFWIECLKFYGENIKSDQINAHRIYMIILINCMIQIIMLYPECMYLLSKLFTIEFTDKRLDKMVNISAYSIILHFTPPLKFTDYINELLDSNLRNTINGSTNI